MKKTLRERCRMLKIEDIDWYMEAYMRCCHRIEHEEHRARPDKLERLRRQLQALFDTISAHFEEDSRRRERERAVAIAINHAVADKGLPRTLLKAYEREKKTAP